METAGEEEVQGVGSVELVRCVNRENIVMRVCVCVIGAVMHLWRQQERRKCRALKAWSWSGVFVFFEECLCICVILQM